MVGSFKEFMQGGEVVPIPEPVLGPRGAGKPKVEKFKLREPLEPTPAPKTKTVAAKSVLPKHDPFKAQFPFGDKTNSRGLRINNPMNLEIGEPWLGRTTRRDKRFETFQSPVFGLRAGARVLRNYQRLHNLSTLSQMIERFAPSSENATGDYINSVAKQIGVDPKAPLDLVGDKDLMRELMKAMVEMEQGNQPFSDETYNLAIDLEENTVRALGF